MIELAKQALKEYGEAIRGDWSQIDGRTTYRELLFVWEVYDGSTSLEDFRTFVDLCPRGHGHWTEYCDAECETG